MAFKGNRSVFDKNENGTSNSNKTAHANTKVEQSLLINNDETVIIQRTNLPIPGNSSVAERRFLRQLTVNSIFRFNELYYAILAHGAYAARVRIIARPNNMGETYYVPCGAGADEMMSYDVEVELKDGFWTVVLV